MRPYFALLAIALMSLFTRVALAGAEQDIDRIEDRRYQAMMAADLAALANILADE